MQGSKGTGASHFEMTPEQPPLAGQLPRATVSGSEAAVSPPAMSEFALANLLRENALSSMPEVAQSRFIALLLTLRPEVTHVAVLTAICASAANVLRKAPELRAARALTRFYPVGSSSLMLASNRLCKIARDSEVSGALEAFSETLSGAMRASMDYTASRQGAADLAAVPVGCLWPAWQRASLAASHLLTAIDEAIAIFNPSRPADDRDVLISALKQAALGESPLREASGDFAIPAWEEQRRSPRLDVSCQASIIVRSELIAIRITDISTGGVGIEIDGHVEEGDVAIIKLGRMLLPGTVIWRRRPRAGFAFDQSLLADSPEYRFLANRSRSGG